MSKKVKMVLYGDPGIGKSTFASKAPNPLFICSDGNFEWLDLPERNGIEIQSWDDCKKILNNKKLLDEYETIVIDLTEDMFKWCEQEYCLRNRIEHISDIGYGKGYQMTRDDFFINISKLIALDKHVIMIMHETTSVEKDRRGVEHTKHNPSSRMPDKLIDMIEGRVRYFLRCYTKDIEIEEGQIIKKRYLSLIPKPGEFGIARGLDEATTPSDIDLDWNEFVKYIKLDTKTTSVRKIKDVLPTTEETKETPVIDKVETKKEEENVQVKSEPVTVNEQITLTKKDEEPKQEISNEEKLAAIRAKLASKK